MWSIKELLGLSPNRDNITSLLDGTFLMYEYESSGQLFGTKKIGWGIFLDLNQPPVKRITDKEAKKLIKSKKELFKSLNFKF